MSNMSPKLATRGFYIEYRTSVMFARENPEDTIPYFNSLEEWEPVKSTKLDTAARLCQYFLQQDGLPIPTFADGGVHFPSVSLVDEVKATKDLKIVVFTEFSSMIGLFINVSLHCAFRASVHGLLVDLQPIWRGCACYQRLHVLRQTHRNPQEISNRVEVPRACAVVCRNDGN